MQLSEDKPYDDINITPMLDLAYVLLVIFILMTTATVEGLRANIPQASKKPPQNKNEKPKTKIIVVNEDGSLEMDKRKWSAADLQTALRAHKAVHPDFPVLIRGNRETQYQAVMSVLDIVVNIGVKQIGLPTQPK
jgi:biopolymer transport protein ExbD